MPTRLVVISLEKDDSVYKSLCYAIELFRNKGDRGQRLPMGVVDLRAVHPPLIFRQDALIMGEDLAPNFVRNGCYLGKLNGV